jgi:hypothetical protein
VSGITCQDSPLPREPSPTRTPPDATALLSASLAVAVAAIVLWLLGGVHVSEVARYLAYEAGFVFAPGLLVYSAVVGPGGGWLRHVVFGWTLGYLLEVVAFYTTAAGGIRGGFVVYPVVVGVPAAAVVAWRRRTVANSTESTPTPFSPRLIWIGAALCMSLLVYAAVIEFTQTPLPRDVGSVTYQEDTVFTISLAAEALHHWPLTLPMVAGQPLHYHLFAYLHMAGIGQVTGIDLSVVVMRLYEFPLLLLLALQLLYAGRRLGRNPTVALAAAFIVLFTGELDPTTHGGRYPFDDLFFYWLLASHTLLLGLVFFLAAVLVFGELLDSPRTRSRTRTILWVSFGAFFIASLGAKSYSLYSLGAGVTVFLVWQFLRTRKVDRAALFALGMCAVAYVIANVAIYRGTTGGAFVSPFKAIERMLGLDAFSAYGARLWGSDVPRALGVPYGAFGLLAIPLVGIALFLRSRRFALSRTEEWYLSLFVGGLPPLVLLSQPGYGQLVLLFLGLVPGTIVAAVGYATFFSGQSRRSLAAAAVGLVAAAGTLLIIGALFGTPISVGPQLTLLWLAATLAGLTLAVRSRRAFGLTLAVAAVVLVLLDTPLIWFVRWIGAGASDAAPFSTWRALVGALLFVSAFALAGFALQRGKVQRDLVVSGLVLACLALGVANTPIDWFPTVMKRAIDGRHPYNQAYSGLTAGLYRGLLRVRNNTDSDAVLVVNNHSLYPDGRDSKYFYYSAFAQRRIVLESWDYTPQAVARHLFSIPVTETPFPRRLALSNRVFLNGGQRAIELVMRKYGAHYAIVDKVHGSTLAPTLALRTPPVFSDPDVDVYDLDALASSPQANLSSCASEASAGFTVDFGHAATPDGADALRGRARSLGFAGLTLQRRGCHDYAAVLTGFFSLGQAAALRRVAEAAGLPVRVECRTYAPSGQLDAVFGHRPTRAAAEQLRTEAERLGFQGLDVQQDRCGDWEVDLRGLRTAAQRRELEAEAANVGLGIVFEPG